MVMPLAKIHGKGFKDEATRASHHPKARQVFRANQKIDILGCARHAVDCQGHTSAQGIVNRVGVESDGQILELLKEIHDLAQV